MLTSTTCTESTHSTWINTQQLLSLKTISFFYSTLSNVFKSQDRRSISYARSSFGGGIYTWYFADCRLFLFFHTPGGVRKQGEIINCPIQSIISSVVYQIPCVCCYCCCRCCYGLPLAFGSVLCVYLCVCVVLFLFTFLSFFFFIFFIIQRVLFLWLCSFILMYNMQINTYIIHKLSCFLP